jgi:hypothetical protein
VIWWKHDRSKPEAALPILHYVLGKSVHRSCGSLIIICSGSRFSESFRKRKIQKKISEINADLNLLHYLVLFKKVFINGVVFNRNPLSLI